MNKLGSLVAVLVLVFGLTVAWQTSTIADTGQSADSQAPAKSGCKAKAECPKAAAEKAAGCEKKCDKAEKAEAGEKHCTKGEQAAKSGCPFAAASATQPSAEKTGCCPKAKLAALTVDGVDQKTCPMTDKAGCQKKCDGDKKCCEKCTGKCDGDKKCCDCKCCGDKAKDGKCDKTSCPMNKDGECTKAEGAKCEKSCPKAAAQAGCPMSGSTTRPSESAEKTGCCAKKAALAAAPAEPKSEGCSKSHCSKSKATVAAATQPAGQTKSCCKSKTSLVSASEEKSATSAQPVAQ